MGRSQDENKLSFILIEFRLQSSIKSENWPYFLNKSFLQPLSLAIISLISLILISLIRKEFLHQ